MGETQFAIVADSTATVINPARLTSLSRFSFALNTSYTAQSFDKYGVVNTGVLITEGNSSMGVYALDFAGLAYNHKGWAIGISIGLLENYERPIQTPEYAENGEVLYRFEFHQTGILRNFNISFARKFGGGLSFGIGVNYVYGSMEKELVENMFYSRVTISDRKTHDLNGIYLNGGLTADISDKFTVAAVFRTPYGKKAKSESQLWYDSPLGNTDIRIDATAENNYEKPLVLGVGADYRISPQLRAAADVSFFNWSTYSITYFDEEIIRGFENIIKVSGGLEYLAAVRLFQQDFNVPLRAGLNYDPQPVKQPSIHYMYYTLGIGLHWKGLHLDASAMLGSEKGSGHDLYARKFSISLSYFL
jgi:long-subunit fatty acid transport protein